MVKRQLYGAKTEELKIEYMSLLATEESDTFLIALDCLRNDFGMQISELKPYITELKASKMLEIYEKNKDSYDTSLLKEFISI